MGSARDPGECDRAGIHGYGFESGGFARGAEEALDGYDAHGELGRPSDLNGLAVFLASDASSFVTGSHIYADVSLPSFFKRIEWGRWTG